MSTQLSVVVAYYRDPERCVTALHSLELLSGPARAVDAAILRRKDPNGRLKIVERAAFHGDRQAGASIASVFPGEVLELDPVGMESNDAAPYFEDQGLDVNLLKEVGENLPPDGAALVIMVEENWLTDLTGMLSGYADFERFVMRPDEPPPAEDAR
jgi:hypothetical protein